MEAAIARVMQAYGLMVNLTSEEKRSARERVSQFLAEKTGDEHQLAVEGVRYLISEPSSRSEAASGEAAQNGRCARPDQQCKAHQYHCQKAVSHFH